MGVRAEGSANKREKKIRIPAPGHYVNQQAAAPVSIECAHTFVSRRADTQTIPARLLFQLSIIRRPRRFLPLWSTCGTGA